MTTEATNNKVGIFHCTVDTRIFFVGHHSLIICALPPLFQISAPQSEPQRCKEHSSDDPMHDDSSDDASTQAETPDRTLQHQLQADDMIVQILARLDGPAYFQALQQDARVRCVLFLCRLEVAPNTTY